MVWPFAEDETAAVEAADPLAVIAGLPSSVLSAAPLTAQFATIDAARNADSAHLAPAPLAGDRCSSLGGKG